MKISTDRVGQSFLFRRSHFSFERQIIEAAVIQVSSKAVKVKYISSGITCWEDRGEVERWELVEWLKGMTEF